MREISPGENVPKPSSPDPEQFARVMLWHLSGIQATLQLREAREIRERGIEDGASSDEIVMETVANAKQIDELARVLYSDAILLANIKPSGKFPLPPKDFGSI